MSPRLGVLNNIPFAIEDEGVGAKEDGFDRLEGADLKAPIEINFIDQFGRSASFYFFTFFYHCIGSRLTGFVWEHGWH